MGHGAVTGRERPPQGDVGVATVIAPQDAPETASPPKTLHVTRPPSAVVDHRENRPSATRIRATVLIASTIGPGRGGRPRAGPHRVAAGPGGLPPFPCRARRTTDIAAGDTVGPKSGRHPAPSEGTPPSHNARERPSVMGTPLLPRAMTPPGTRWPVTYVPPVIASSQTPPAVKGRIVGVAGHPPERGKPANHRAVTSSRPLRHRGAPSAAARR